MEDVVPLILIGNYGDFPGPPVKVFLDTNVRLLELASLGGDVRKSMSK